MVMIDNVQKDVKRYKIPTVALIASFEAGL